MAYFLIGFKPERMDEFKKRFSFLESAVCISDLNQLSEELERSSEGDIFFLFAQEEGLEELNPYAQKIREGGGAATLLMVSSETSPSVLKEHQLSTAGADAYISENVDFDLLKEMLSDMATREEKTSEIRRSDVTGLNDLKKMQEHPISKEMDELFQNNLPQREGPEALDEVPPMPEELSLAEENELDIGDLGDSSTKTDNDLGEDLGIANKKQDDDILDLGEDALDEGFDLSLSETEEAAPTIEEGTSAQAEDEGLELDLSDDDLDLSDEAIDDESLDLSDDGDEGISLDLSDNNESGVLSLSNNDNDDDDDGLALDLGDDSPDLVLGDDAPPATTSNDQEDLELIEDVELGSLESSAGTEISEEAVEAEIDLSLDEGHAEAASGEDLSEDAMAKLAEIDALMETDSTQSSFNMPQSRDQGDDLEQSLVGDDLDLDGISFSEEDEESIPEESSKKTKSKKKETSREEADQFALGKDLKEISGAWNSEMERTQATLANLRADRQELLGRIQELEENKVMHNRQMLTLRAELDERKIELSIIRKKLNDEISELKDRLKLHDERRLILEEKNRILMQELDKSAHKNKLDVKRIQMRERELEQRLELLKADAETQIRNRDLKILELKRKIDAMEFDMESISQQEKRSVESRFELEDKLDKAIKTLRTAITVLEDESQRGNALDALKKNIDI